MGHTHEVAKLVETGANVARGPQFLPHPRLAYRAVVPFQIEKTLADLLEDHAVDPSTRGVGLGGGAGCRQVLSNAA